MVVSSSIWTRLKTSWIFWKPHAQYEYPEAHRLGTSTNTAGTTSTSSSASMRNLSTGSSSKSEAASTLLDSPAEELLKQQLLDHPLHTSRTQRFFKGAMQTVLNHVVMTAVHASIMYVMWFHVKPRLVRYYQSRHNQNNKNRIKGKNNSKAKKANNIDGADDVDGTENSESFFTSLKRKLFGTKSQLCCCCDCRVTPQDKYCKACGSPTAPLCIYCGNGLTNNVNFCPSCGKPVPNQVIVDDCDDDDDANYNYRTTRPSAPLPPSPPLSPKFVAAAGSAAAVLFGNQDDESKSSDNRRQHHYNNAREEVAVPMVQAEDYLPLIPAMYVEEVTALDAISTITSADHTTAETTAAVDGQGRNNQQPSEEEEERGSSRPRTLPPRPEGIGGDGIASNKIQ